MRQPFNKKKISLLGIAIAALSVNPVVLAQEEAALEEVVVTGFRQSLQYAADAKRASVNITDSVFAEDIGKFADLNIAEAINRVPGMQIRREIDGSGVNISIRGLGTNFTKTLVNGAPVAVATSGVTDSQNANREVDLDLFPTELFTRLDVNKTPTAAMLEGGVAGTVNMRTARPFDNPDLGTQVNYQLQGTYRELGEDISPRGALIASWKNETFGVLGGIAVANNKVTTEGFETFGYTNPRLTQVQCGSGDDPVATGSCNTIGGGDWTIPSTVPANAGLGLVEGTVIDDQFLLDNNPGTSIEQIANGIVPRIGRPHWSQGNRDRLSALLSFELRPNDNMSFFLDTLYAEGDRDFNRLDMMLVGRAGALIPTNLQVDANNVVTSADYANAQFFLEARPYKEAVEYLSISPGGQIIINEGITLDFMGYYSESDWRREAPTVGAVTNMNQGVSAQYRNLGGDIPVFHAFDANGNEMSLNDPNLTAGWGWERALIQNEDRKTDTEGLHVDFTFGDEQFNIKTGLHYDASSRFIQGSDGSALWENYACRGGWTEDSADPRPGCRGVPGSRVPNSELNNYLIPSEAGFISVDYDRIFADTNYPSFLDQAEPGNGSATGAQTGSIDEETSALYIEASGSSDVLNRPLRYNLGLRYITTDQEVGSPTAADPAVFAYVDSSYDALLPSFNSAWEFAENWVVRLSASQTITRANPTSLLPRVNFSDPSAANGSQGNVELQPFKSTNGDIAIEWYTGDEGYVSLVFFRKDLTGFTVSQNQTVTFNELSELSGGGIVWDDLTDTQRESINVQGGPDQNTITLSQPVNGNGVLSVEGIELTWQQPLDFIVDGLGFNSNYTKIHQSSTGGGIPAFITGTSDSTVNFTLYYETGDFSTRVAYTWLDEQYASGLNQNNMPLAQRFQQAQGQWDASASYEFSNLPTSPAVTLNLINFAGDPQRQIFSYDNAPYLYYNPGYQVILGVRGTF